MKPSDDFPSDYEECEECGFDHAYEYEEAYKWHKQNEECIPMFLFIEFSDETMIFTDDGYVMSFPGSAFAMDVGKWFSCSIQGQHS